jgi:hypothetical protein
MGWYGKNFVRFHPCLGRVYLLRKTLEDTKRQPSATKPRWLPCGAGRPHLQAVRPVGGTNQPPLHTSVLHHLLDCIYAILLSRFDPRV